MSAETMEVLAPAGGPEALKAAVFAGADAVYLAGPAFGARANARNFSREELAEAMAFCHARGVRVHVTVNTLLKEQELEEALRWVEFLCSLGADAVLVQDLGLFSLLRQRAPELPLHASTQMSLHTPGGVRLLQELGASRVVLARELSLPEIREIAENSSTELEAFVHGALCMSLSGQCYFSAMLGGRSGNRGQCAQPCRLPFSCDGGTGHDLSLKDLSFIREIGALSSAGVCSAKIEGRMKRPEYVAAAVSACRRAADGGAVPEDLLEKLGAVFSRSGFTDGYLTGRRGASMFGVRTREDVTGATEKVFSSLRGLYKGEYKRIAAALELKEEQGLLALTARDSQGREARAELPIGGGKFPLLARERCISQLEKTGGTPFFLTGVEVPDRGVRAGVSQLNALRREVLDKLLALRARRDPIPFSSLPYRAPLRVKQGKKLWIRTFFRSPEQVCEEALSCESIVLPLDTELAVLQRLRERGFDRILLEQPRAFFGGEGLLRAQMEEKMKAGFREFVCGNLGGLALGRELRAELHGGYSLNVYNTPALELLERLGLSSAELSFELTGREACALGGSLPRGLMLYGRQALMLTRNCPLANSPAGCRNCREPNFLTDRKNVKFPVVCTGRGGARYAEVLNSVPLWLGDKLQELSGLDFGTVRFTVENSVESGALLRCIFRQEPPDFDYTRGLFARGVE